MINQNILKIASDTKYYGLKNIYTHQSKAKNRICGDVIEIEIKVTRNKIKLMRYETQSCIFCQATASILANKIEFISIKHLKKDIQDLRKTIKNNGNSLPDRFKSFNKIINNEVINRFDCIMLPFNALLKALKI